MSPQLTLTVKGAPPEAVIDAGIRCGWLPDRPPDIERIDKGRGSWRERFLSTSLDPWVGWGPEDDTDAAASHSHGGTVMGAKLSGALDPAAVFARLEAIPFTIAEITNLHPEWRRPPISYRGPSFGGMPSHGWVCAFRGAGHDVLVSRRWLTHGPWRLHQRAGDLSIVEFHDAAADGATAADQARPGHARMGNTPEGGYIQPNFVYTAATPRGFYEKDTGIIKVIVNRRPLAPRELLEACAVRVETRPMEPGPVKNVAYVFMEEDEARVNLHELWLRGLECRAIRLGQEVRLDADYAPAPNPPAWT